MSVSKSKTKAPAKASKKAVIKTTQNTASVESFINSVQDETRRKDSNTILDMMKKATKEEPRMWGSSLIGFGKVTVKSPNTGREVDWFRMGFSPRKANFSLYLSGDIKKYADDLKKLGKHKTGVGCLYINRLEDVDVKILKKLIDDASKKKWL